MDEEWQKVIEYCRNKEPEVEIKDAEEIAKQEEAYWRLKDPIKLPSNGMLGNIMMGDSIENLFENDIPNTGLFLVEDTDAGITQIILFNFDFSFDYDRTIIDTVPVRPIIMIDNSNHFFNVGDKITKKIQGFKETFTVITSDYALCDHIIMECPYFDKAELARSLNIPYSLNKEEFLAEVKKICTPDDPRLSYENSTIRKRLLDWYR